jgi:hypothetical protein
MNELSASPRASAPEGVRRAEDIQNREAVRYDFMKKLRKQTPKQTSAYDNQIHHEKDRAPKHTNS